VWIYGALRVKDGQEITLTTHSRNTAGYLQMLNYIEMVNPEGDLYLIADNLTSHKSAPIQEWLAAHPRIQQVFIPKGACWLNMQEGWWRLFRREALAGQTFVDGAEIDQARGVATQQLNGKAKPWVWGRPPRPHRHLRRAFVYLI
jgi:transposase